MISWLTYHRVFLRLLTLFFVNLARVAHMSCLSCEGSRAMHVVFSFLFQGSFISQTSLATGHFPAMWSAHLKKRYGMH